jgi:hypothetical protein
MQGQSGGELTLFKPETHATQLLAFTVQLMQ